MLDEYPNNINWLLFFVIALFRIDEMQIFSIFTNPIILLDSIQGWRTKTEIDADVGEVI